MSRDERSLRSLVRSPRRTCVRRTYRPLPTYTRLAGERPARPLRSFAPPGSPFGTTLSLGQAEAARRCSPGVLSPSRALSTTVQGPVSRGSARRGQSPILRASPGAQVRRSRDRRLSTRPLERLSRLHSAT